MDLHSRKYSFIEEFIKIDNEIVLNELEQILKKERISQYEVSSEHKKILIERLENYKNNPENVLDWENVRSNW